MERDKREFQKAQVKLDQRVTNLEHLLHRNLYLRTSEGSKKTKKRKCSLSRCRSLEMLDTLDKPLMQTARYTIFRFAVIPKLLLNHKGWNKW